MAGRTEPVLLYAHPSMEKLAEQVTEICSRSHRPKVINVDVTEKAGTVIFLPKFYIFFSMMYECK